MGRSKGTGRGGRKPIHAFDDSGTLVASYASRTEAGRAVGRSASAFTLGTDPYVWAAGLRWATNARARLGVAPHARPVRAYDGLGRQVGAYANPAEAAARLGVSAAHVRRSLRAGVRAAGVHLRWADEDAPDAPGGRAVYAFGDHGLQVGAYPCAAEAATAVSRSTAAIYHALGSSQRVCAGLRWSRSPDALSALPPPPPPRPAPARKQRRTRPIHAFDAAGTRVGTYVSQKAAAQAVGVRASQISVASKNGWCVGGLRWLYGDHPAPAWTQAPVFAFTRRGVFVARYAGIQAAADALNRRPEDVKRALTTGHLIAGLRVNLSGVPPTPPARPRPPRWADRPPTPPPPWPPQAPPLTRRRP